MFFGLDKLGQVHPIARAVGNIQFMFTACW